MKRNSYWFSGLMFAVALVLLFNQSESSASAGKYHPKGTTVSHTKTVTVLNPALFHRLNAVLEHGLLQEN